MENSAKDYSTTVDELLDQIKDLLHRGEAREALRIITELQNYVSSLVSEED